MFVFTVTPGATTAVVVRHTLAGGRRRGFAVSLGANAANATQALAAMIGVSALLASWPQGSPAHASYFARITQGPRFTADLAQARAA